ncbi:hypothetical protein K8O68_03890 [Salipaludibacillus sp. CUR1]|uniref:TlpA family protein disulfide reductase n=1 Tax=Salipaludibacillus sp. CUR1 TaxID=2820003 RepID=UPI001E38DC69|nr:hypothetical protein [Salipaludibacillus sp. CUR1]MCE7791567.1 hypothetical protein [Salipaludibacillus sp. CUR1]
MEAFIFYSVILLWITQFITLFALFLLFRQFGEVYLSTGAGISKDGLPVGRPFPAEVKVLSLDFNNPAAMASFMEEGKPALITFISPNCKPCLRLLDDWNEAFTVYGDQINFFTVIVGEETEVTHLADTYSFSGCRLWDRHKELFNRCLIRVTPFAFAVDEKGLITDKGLCGNKKQIELLAFSVLDLRQTGGKEGFK